MTAKNNTDMISAAEQQLVTWPLPALVVERIQAMRKRVAMLCSPGRSV
jgi:hypothetical protein